MLQVIYPKVKRLHHELWVQLTGLSDILRRHEATHIARDINRDAHSSNTRACTECARGRERCTKNNPCGRCASRGLQCTFPPPKTNARNQRWNAGRSSSVNSSVGSAMQTVALNISNPGDGANITSLLPLNGLGDKTEHIKGRSGYVPLHSLVCTSLHSLIQALV